MLRRTLALALSVLALSGVGCIMIVKVKAPPHKHRCHERVIEIDGEMYDVDLEEGTIEKAETDEVVHETKIIRTEVDN
jgi:hypothetical protein